LTDSIELDADFAQDPHGLYDRLRAEAPVRQVSIEGGVRAWLVTRHADVLALLNDPRLSTDQSRALAQFEPDRARPYDGELFQDMLRSDPPAHTRLRRLVVKAFTTRAVERMKPRIELIADDLLDGIERGEPGIPVDLIANYAEPLPIRVISEMLGMPAEQAGRFRSASNTFISMTTHAVKAEAEREMIAVLNEVVDLKRRTPGDDLLTSLINASSDGDSLSHGELIGMCSLLTVAGYETTVHLIANAVLALLNNPSQLEAVRADPETIPDAVEEVLRFDGPVNIAVPRYTTADVTVGDVVIPSHSVVMIALVSANRDEVRFEHPERFDVSRTSRGHLAFGYGIHHCLGAPLARMEGTIALRRLLDRYAHIELDRTEPLRYRATMNIHGVATLPVWLRKGGDDGADS
jgi:cytochrome P450